MARFQNGVIYWSPGTNAHVVHGAMLEEWARNGHEAGRYGYPLNDQSGEGFNTVQTFQKRKMTWLQNAGGQRNFIFQPQDPIYLGSDEVGTFSAQVSYASAPDKYPLAWGMRLSQYVESVAAIGGATPMRCESFHQENGRATASHWDKASPGAAKITVDYPMHASVPNHRIGATEDLLGYCSFADKSGGDTFVTWSFRYQVLDYNLPQPGGI